MTGHSRWPPLGSVAFTAAGAIAVDLSTKQAVINLVSLRRLPFVDLTRNPSLSLGIGGPGHSPAVLALVSAIALIAAVAIGRRLLATHPDIAVPVGLFIGGSTGNLCDRVMYGAVTDWLWIPLVTINFADIAVVAGITACVLMLSRRRTESAKPTSGADRKAPAPLVSVNH